MADEQETASSAPTPDAPAKSSQRLPSQRTINVRRVHGPCSKSPVHPLPYSKPPTATHERALVQEIAVNVLLPAADAGTGTRSKVHARPSHASAIGRETHRPGGFSHPLPNDTPPTARHDLRDVHETASRPLDHSPRGPFAGRRTHALPFHRSAQASGPPGAPGPLPTATHHRFVTHETESSPVNVVAPADRPGSHHSTTRIPTTPAARAITARTPVPVRMARRQPTLARKPRQDKPTLGDRATPPLS